MDLVPLDEQRQLFISPKIDEWKSVEDQGITAVIDFDGDLVAYGSSHLNFPAPC
jgi:hypothetical protein